MIDTTTEEVFSLTDAVNRLPRQWGSKRPHVSTLYRWSTRGRNGVVLETLQVGDVRCTSVEALQRFFDRRLSASRVSTRCHFPNNVQSIEDKLRLSLTLECHVPNWRRWFKMIAWCGFIKSGIDLLWIE